MIKIPTPEEAYQNAIDSAQPLVNDILNEIVNAINTQWYGQASLEVNFSKAVESIPAKNSINQNLLLNGWISSFKSNTKIVLSKSKSDDFSNRGGGWNRD